MRVREGEEESEANRRTFGICSANDAFGQANISSVGIDQENDAYRHRYIAIQYYPT